MCSRVVRLLVWNAMVHERVHAFSWPTIQRMFKRMQSLVQNNEMTDQREGENMSEKEGETMKQTGVYQQNNVRDMQDVQQQNVQQQSPSDITADKRESFTEKELDATLEKAERPTGRRPDNNGRNEKNDSGGNCCGEAGAQKTDRRTPGLRHTRNDCCDTKAQRQSRNVNQNLIGAKHASKYTVGWGYYEYISKGVGISVILTCLGGLLYRYVGAIPTERDDDAPHGQEDDVDPPEQKANNSGPCRRSNPIYCTTENIDLENCTDFPSECCFLQVCGFLNASAEIILLHFAYVEYESLLDLESPDPRPSSDPSEHLERIKKAQSAFSVSVL